MFPARGSHRTDLSTEFGFAVVEGIELIWTTPGRVSRHVTGQVNDVAARIQGAAASGGARVARLTGRGRPGRG